MRTTGAELVVRVLEEEGVRFAFGIPGTHNIELYDALARSEEVEPVLVTDEQAASFMADGVARSTGAAGVLNLVPGAGVTHALSGIAEAYMDSVPLVVLACGIRNDTGKAYQLHDIDQLALLRPVTKAAWRAESPDRIVPLLRSAFALARSGTPGPVAVEIPANYYLLSHEVPEALPLPPLPEPPRPTPDALAEAAAILGAARRPALYLGLGAAGAADLLPRLAETLDAPVCTTISGKGVFPEHHPLFLWNGFGRSAPPFVRAAMDRCDALLAVGCRFGEVATGSYGLETPANLIHVDVNPEVFGRNVAARLDVTSDARAFVEALLPLLAARPSSEALARAIADGHRAVRETWAREASATRVTPAALFDALAALAADPVFVADSGNGTFLAMEHLRLDRPRSFLAPVDYSCMGYAPPAAIGAALANPGRDVVALCGDGALLMTGLELLTAAARGVRLVACVLRDGELAQIAQFQRTALNRATCAELADYSVEALARATNCEPYAVARDAELEPVLRRAFDSARAGRPALVDVAIDYTRKTYFTRGVVATNLLRLPWRDRLRFVGRALARRFGD
ncbi:MAG: thiamine pyrophosphate-binding protein [Acidobacteriota bacterium]